MPSTPSILQVLPRLDSGGVERGTLDISRAIIAEGWRSVVASGGGHSVPTLLRSGAQHETLPLHSKNPFTIWRNIARLEALIKREGISLIHARSRAPAWAAYYAAKRCNIPFVTTFHGAYSRGSKYKNLYNSVMARGDQVIAVSEFIREHILAHYATPSADITVIPRGVDFSLFDPEKPNPERFVHLNREWRIPEDPRKIILCPGRFSRIKGQHVLLHALPLLKDIPFLCVFMGKQEGHESYVNELEKDIDALGLMGLVRMAPPTAYMPEAYLLADVVVVPSLQPEAFGRIAVEAQAMGKMVVATDQGGAKETIIANETGYVVPPNDPKAIAKAVHFALTLEDETKDAVRAYAMQHVRESFSLKRMQRDTLNLYKRVLSDA
jgi:glycosyltransferase involved in cell wall biosynthesis